MKLPERRFRLAGAGAVLAILGRASAEWPAFVEWHRTSVLPGVAGLLQALSGVTAANVGEGLVILLAGAALISLFVKRTAAIPALALAGGLAVLSFYALWGLAYRYSPLTGRLAAGGQDRDAAGRFIELAEGAARLVGRSSFGLAHFEGEADALMARINAGLAEGAASLPASIEASPVRGVAFGPVKLSRVSFALSRLQLSGYYLPWTGEAQINAEMPRTLWPRVAAHEKAHQRGFAPENEASVVGLLMCLRSSDPLVFYSGALGLFVNFDRELAGLDREARSRIWAMLPARATEDFRNEAAFWKAHDGVAGAVSEKVNDTYLKAQGVRSGVRSYGETTRLILQVIETDSLGIAPLLKGPSPPQTKAGGVG
jgi:Protein of unknown function (DUF3810)